MKHSALCLRWSKWMIFIVSYVTLIALTLSKKYGVKTFLEKNKTEQTFSPSQREKVYGKYLVQEKEKSESPFGILRVKVNKSFLRPIFLKTIFISQYLNRRTSFINNSFNFKHSKFLTTKATIQKLLFKPSLWLLFKKATILFVFHP